MTVQIICFVGALIVCFLLGRASKQVKIPILGRLIFYEGEEKPKLFFKCDDLNEFKKRKYIAIQIESRQNHVL